MTEDIVLNITANIQPMADELNHLMSTMELVPNKEQLTEAIDSIHGAYQTIKTESKATRAVYLRTFRRGWNQR